MSHDDITTNSENKIKKMYNSGKTIILLILKSISNIKNQIRITSRMRMREPRYRQ